MSRMSRKGLLLALTGAIFLGTTACRTIDSGEAGVLWRAIGGTNMDKVYGEGFHIVAPWNSLYVYNIKSIDVKEEMDIVTANGLTVSAEFSIRFHPLREELPKLHSEVGRYYYDIVVGPVLRSQARKVLGRYEPEEIYSTKREAIEQETRDAVTAEMQGKHIAVEGVFLRSFKLPQQLQEAINNKLTQQQKSQEMQFVLQREQQEAERKRIEAEGIRDFQKIVTEGISERLLKWKGIETTEKLAQSQNAKIVIVGNNDQSLPVILSAD